MEPHRLAEERSLAYHHAVAARIAAEPRLLSVARARAEQWVQSNERHAPYARRWLALLSQPLAKIQAALIDPSEEGLALRQATPFAGALTPRERWRIWREVRDGTGTASQATLAREGRG